MSGSRTSSIRAAATLVAFLVGAGGPRRRPRTGTISGTIIDESDQVVPGATVTLINEQTQAARTATTGPDGRFAFRAVPAGAYTVKMSSKDSVRSRAGTTSSTPSSHLDLDRIVAGSRRAERSRHRRVDGHVVETKNSDYSGLLTATQISQIQTRGRDVMSLLRLLPGVRYEGDIEAMGDSFGSHVPNIGGQRRHWNQVTVDGLNGNELSGTNRFSSAINLDAIAEVKVLLNTYKAEFGRSGGANIADRQQERQHGLHGSAYYYGRRDSWNANPWENNRAGLAEAEATHRHVRLQSRRAGRASRGCGSRMATRSCSSSTRSKRRRCRVRVRSGCTACRPSSSGRAISRRSSISTGRLIVIVVDPVTPASRSPATSSRRTASIPNTLALLNMLPLPNHRRRPAPTTSAAGDVGQPALEQCCSGSTTAARASQHVLGRAPHVQFEPVRLGDHRGAGATGASSTAPTSSRTAR